MKEGSWKLYHSLCLLQKFSREGNRPQGWGNPRAPLLQVDPCTHTNSCAYLQEWSADRVEWHRLPLELSSPWELGETDSSRSYNKKKVIYVITIRHRWYTCTYMYVHVHMYMCMYEHWLNWIWVPKPIHVMQDIDTQLNWCQCLQNVVHKSYARYWCIIRPNPNLSTQWRNSGANAYKYHIMQAIDTHRVHQKHLT